MPKQPASRMGAPSRISWEADDGALVKVRGIPGARGTLIALAILAVVATALGVAELSRVQISVGGAAEPSASAEIPDRQVAN